jgi:hypothetical protein
MIILTYVMTQVSMLTICDIARLAALLDAAPAARDTCNSICGLNTASNSVGAVLHCSIKLDAYMCTGFSTATAAVSPINTVFSGAATSELERGLTGLPSAQMKSCIIYGRE